MFYIDLLCYAVLCWRFGISDGHTRYQWYVDRRMEYNYDPNPMTPQGVYNWPSTYPNQCGGMYQSPVDIRTDSVIYNSASCSCPRLKYEYAIIHGEFKNNGHSPLFMPDKGSQVTLSNIPHRPGTYKLHDFHFHYGGISGRTFESQGMRRRGSSAMSAGSEHTIDGLRFDGELHFVFYNSKYGSLETADDKPDGVAVVVLLIQLIPPTIQMTTETLEFSNFLERTIPKIRTIYENMTSVVDLSMFFNRRCEYYTYGGSTTTPLCYQSVRWIIYREPLVVTEQAWYRLTGLQSVGDFNARFGNYRYTQPMNGRIIEANFGSPSNLPIRPFPDGDLISMIVEPRLRPRPVSPFRDTGSTATMIEPRVTSLSSDRPLHMFSKNTIRFRQPLVYGFPLMSQVFKKAYLPLGIQMSVAKRRYRQRKYYALYQSGR